MQRLVEKREEGKELADLKKERMISSKHEAQVRAHACSITLPRNAKRWLNEQRGQPKRHFVAFARRLHLLHTHPPGSTAFCPPPCPLPPSQLLIEQQLASIAQRQGLADGVLSDPEKASTVATRVAELILPEDARNYFHSPQGVAEVRHIQEKSGATITLESSTTTYNVFVARLSGTEFQVKMGSELLQHLLVRAMQSRRVILILSAGKQAVSYSVRVIALFVLLCVAFAVAPVKIQSSFFSLLLSLSSLLSASSVSLAPSLVIPLLMPRTMRPLFFLLSKCRIPYQLSVKRPN